MLEAVAVISSGNPDASLTDAEHDQIVEPLSRVVKRMSPKASRRFQTITDPLTVVTGLGFWAIRVATLPRPINPNRQTIPTPQQPPVSVYPEANANGENVTSSAPFAPGVQPNFSVNGNFNP